MPTVTITSDQRIKSINIVFADDGASDVQVVETSDSTTGTSSHHDSMPTPASPSGLPYEIDHEDFDSINEDGIPIPEDNRKTVGESLDGVDFDAPMTQDVKPSNIVIPDISDRPPLVDNDMGAEL